jgi:hypothetical protein
MWVQNMENMGKRERTQNFRRRTSEDDTPGEITGGLPKMHLVELSARYRLDWTGSQYMVKLLFRMYRVSLKDSSGFKQLYIR